MARIPGFTADAALGSATNYYQSGAYHGCNLASEGVIPQEMKCGTGTGTVGRCLYRCCDITIGPYGVPIMRCDPPMWICGHSSPPDAGMIGSDL
jgi:hypothetical protein